ncbi:hypothetical protein ACJX0J_026323, partial [Zea mays]
DLEKNNCLGHASIIIIIVHDHVQILCALECLLSLCVPFQNHPFFFHFYIGPIYTSHTKVYIVKSTSNNHINFFTDQSDFHAHAYDLPKYKHMYHVKCSNNYIEYNLYPECLWLNTILRY